MKSHRKHAPEIQAEKPVTRTTAHKLYPIKGRKQRLDERKAAEKVFWLYFEWDEDDRGRKAKCLREGHLHKRYHCGTWGDDWFTVGLRHASVRLNKLYAAARKDGIV